MILIYWKGKVGNAVAKLCQTEGISYEIRDDWDAPSDFSLYEYIIPSPGIAEAHTIYKTGKVVTELDFAYKFLPKQFSIVAVTGTDGKSTTSWILYNIIKKEYFVNNEIFLSWNFDIPLSETVSEIRERKLEKGTIVIEISSFMSYGIGNHPDFSPFLADYSIFTNFKKDHLNWHAGIQWYLDAKMNLLKHTKKVSVVSDQVKKYAEENNLTISFPSNTRFFATSHQEGSDDWTDGENIFISGDALYKLSETKFTGMHNAQNILASTLVTTLMGIPQAKTVWYLKEIDWLEHRLEQIGTKDGIILVEDSKSTSAQSLEAALGSYGKTKNLLLIAGGSDKWDTFNHLGELFRKRVKSLACIGATKEHFIRLAEDKNIPYLATDNLDEAVEFLFWKWQKDDVLMLSPGCASFWLFKDYFERATKFREAIKKLP